MDEAFDAGFDLHERAVRNQVGDLAFDLGSSREALLDLVPRIVGRLLETEGDALLVFVDLEDLELDFLADLEQFARVGEATPGHVGDVKQSVHAAEVDEGAEIGEIFHRAGDHRADVGAGHELLAFFAAFLLDEFAAAEDHVAAVIVEFDDFEIVGVADELIEVLRRDDVDLRGRQESLDADVDQESAFDHGFDPALDDAFVLENLADFVPVLAVGGLFFGKDDHAFVVLETDEQDFDFVADGDFGRIVEFRGGDGAFGLVVDVDEKFAGADFQNAAFDNAAFFELFGRVGDQFLDLRHNNRPAQKARELVFWIPRFRFRFPLRGRRSLSGPIGAVGKHGRRSGLGQGGKRGAIRVAVV